MLSKHQPSNVHPSHPYFHQPPCLLSSGLPCYFPGGFYAPAPSSPTYFNSAVSTQSLPRSSPTTLVSNLFHLPATLNASYPTHLCLFVYLWIAFRSSSDARLRVACLDTMFILLGTRPHAASGGVVLSSDTTFRDSSP
ncbi:hypothetical protein HGRIS_013151 [Hohenbuehelia grisea]|uniref:Uncharacterized protein n=1 Tax=Hohenbuehelia grisea TaxID=104357 RepID=A0ABR3IUQ6_9AGAR